MIHHPAHPGYPNYVSWAYTDEESAGQTIDIMWKQLPPTEHELIRGWFRLTNNGETDWNFRGELVDLVSTAINHRAACLFTMEPHKALMGGMQDLNGCPPPPSYGYQGRSMKTVWAGPMGVFMLTRDVTKEVPDCPIAEWETALAKFEFPPEFLQAFVDDYVNFCLS